VNNPEQKREKLLEKFHSRLIALERRSPLTAETYRYEISRFLIWLEGQNLSFAAMTLPDLSSYLYVRRSADGIGSRSVAKAISALRSFSRFQEDEGLEASTALASLLEIPRRLDRLPEVHSREDVDALLSRIETDTPLGIRNRSLYELIYSAGMRVSEAVSLNTQDIFIGKNLAKVKGKGSKERMVIFGSEAAFWLRRYLKEARPELAGNRNGKALFLGRSGKRLSRKGIWKNYSALAMEAGLSTKLHTLRHTFATELLSGGADLRSVQELLGHAEMSTTQVYTHVNSRRLRESYQKHIPKLKSWTGIK
jgi:integrase/recombinase XerD